MTTDQAIKMVMGIDGLPTLPGHHSLVSSFLLWIKGGE